MVRLILTTWIKLSQTERSQLSPGQMEVRMHLHTEFITSIGEHLSNILESFNSDVAMVVPGQKRTAFINDCLCGIKAITQNVYLKFAYRQTTFLILNFFFI